MITINNQSKKNQKLVLMKYIAISVSIRKSHKRVDADRSPRWGTIITRSQLALE